MWGGIVNLGIRWNFYESRLYPSSYSAQFLILFWPRGSSAIVTLCLAENALDLFHCRESERRENYSFDQRLASVLVNDGFRVLIFTRVDIIQECVSITLRYWSLSGPLILLAIRCLKPLFKRIRNPPLPYIVYDVARFISICQINKLNCRIKLLPLLIITR